MDTAANHTFQIISICNGGSKARRASCSYGFKGVRFPYNPGPGTLAKASARAQADGADHVAEMGA